MLELRHVTKRFPGIAAVDQVSFTASPGEVTGYLGPNGSGKSTTMKMIAGLMDPSAGEILFEGRRSGTTRWDSNNAWATCRRTRTCTRISAGWST